MKQINNPRVSSYVNYFNLPGDKYVCVVHGYSSAVDMIDGSLAKVLEDGTVASQVDNAETGKLLATRGYLTTKTLDEEKAFVTQINKLFIDRQSQSRFTHFEISLAPRVAGENEYVSEPGFLDNVFLVINEIRGIDVTNTVRLNLLGADPSRLELIDKVFDLARDWDFKVEVIASEGQLQSVAPKLRKHLVAKLSILIESLGEDWLRDRDKAELDGPYSSIIDALSKHIRVECLAVVDSASREELSALLKNVGLVRSRLKADLRHHIVLVPITRKAGSRDAIFVTENFGAYPIQLEELDDYRQVESYVWSGKLVRLRPAFSQLPRLYKLYSTGEIGLTKGFGEQEQVIGNVLPDSYAYDAAEAEEDFNGAGLEALPGECASCLLSLLCGGNCNVRQQSVGDHYRQKMARLLTIPILNVV